MTFSIDMGALRDRASKRIATVETVATLLPEAGSKVATVAWVAGDLAELVDAINCCCDVRGDEDANRAALIAEASDFTPDQQRDLIEHFREQAAIYEHLPAPARRTT